MARRDITDFNTVTNVVADDSGQAGAAAAAVGQAIIKQSQEAKIIEGMSAAQLELGKLANDFQIKFEGDPFNEQGLKDYRTQRQGVIDKYGSQISPVFKRSWTENALNLSKSNDVQMQAWGYKQSAVNTKTSIANSMQNYLTQAAADGEAFGASQATEIGSFLKFAQAKEQLQSFGNQYLGETSTQAITKDFEQDWAKVFISGVAHKNPAKALKMMDNEQVRATFTDADEFMKFRGAVETRALNVGEVLKQQEVLNTIKKENKLFSSDRALSYAEIQLATQSMSEPARDYFMKVNGYSKSGEDSLDLGEKLQVKADIYNQISQLGQSENITPENISELQGNVYTAMRKGALTQQEGANFITQLVEPVVAQKEEQMSQFSSGQWNPFKDNVGFKELENFYSEQVEIKPAEGEEKPGAVSQAINATNKANLYDNYWNALQTEAAKRNVTVGDIPKLQDADAVYAAAQDKAQRQYTASSSPVLKLQPSIPITSIQALLKEPARAGEFDKKYGPGAANRILGK